MQSSASSTTRVGMLCCILAALWGTRLLAQNACSNPHSLRVGIFIAPAPTSRDPVLQRKFQVESKLLKALTAQFGEAACVVTDVAIFDDKANYPLLKGSLFLNLHARPSFKDPDLAAVAVDIDSVQGPYADNHFHIGVVPVLIEKDTNYDDEAKAVLQYEAAMVDAWSGKR